MAPNGDRRILFITNIISPYRIPFLNALSDADGIELEVVYVAEQEKNRQWKTYKDEIIYSYEVLEGVHLSTGNRTVHLNYGLSHLVSQFKPDVVIIGTDILSTPASWIALYSARQVGAKVLRFEGQHAYTTNPGGIKSFLYRRFYNHCDHFFVYSRLTKAYLQGLGIDAAKITIGYNVGDTEFVSREVEAYISSPYYESDRERYPDVLFLFSGRLTIRKNILGLLTVFQDLALPDAGLIILGTGELADAVVEFIERHNLTTVLYEGFKQKSEVIRYLALCDVFVLPSFSDPASIVLSEALFSGLYTVASSYDGSAVNFIIEGQNGVIVDPRNHTELRKALVTCYILKKSGGLNKERIRATMAEFCVQSYSQRLEKLINRL
ncbi:MAG: glycosyltransferase family 4 protein [Desulforhabdus sp.]|nr:glycosyltransferase family 4 protein [Desulforhabdus sp.]